MLRQWDVFFSHSTRLDANTFTDRLISGVYFNLTTTGHRVFWDRESALDESPLVHGLRHHLDGSRIAVLFLNNCFWDSTWVELELDHIARRFAGGRLQVLCVRTEPAERVPGWVACGRVMDVPSSTPVNESARLICRQLEHMLDSGRGSEGIKRARFDHQIVRRYWEN